MDTSLALVLAVLGLLSGVKVAFLQEYGDETKLCTIDENNVTICDETRVCSTDENNVTVCACAEGHFNESGVCIKRMLFSPCDNNDDCQQVLNFSHCSGENEAQCRCLIGYKESPDNSSCIPLKLGDSCEKKDECKKAVRYSKCKKKKNICICRKDYHEEGNGTECVKKIIGDRCGDRPEECVKIGANVGCQNGSCVCGAGYEASGPKSCKMIELDGPCLRQDDCKSIGDNAECKNNKCSCKVGYFQSAPLACDSIKLNNVCRHLDDCEHIENSDCPIETSVCSCKYGYKKNHTTSACDLMKIKDVTCNFSTNCTSLFNYTECNSRTHTCQCYRRFHDSGTHCQFFYLDHMCDRHSHCSKSVDNSQCSDVIDHGNGQCECKSHYTPGEDKKVCILQVIGGQNCTIDGQCSSKVKNSKCNKDYGRCACKIGYRVVNEDYNTCSPVNHTDTCSTNEECSTTNPHSICLSSRKCGCGVGYIAKLRGGRWRCNKQRIGEYGCHTDEDCSSAVDNSKCRQCGSSRKHYFCWRNCAKTDTSSGLPSHCTFRTCQCQVGYYSDSGYENCLMRKLNDNCENNEECGLISAAWCHPEREKCECRVGFKENGNYNCIRRRIGDGCGVRGDCSIRDSECKGNMCVCRTGFVPTKGGNGCRLRQLYAPADKCSHHENCTETIPGSYCNNIKRTCFCKEEYVPSPNQTVCLKRQLGNVCQQDSHCQKAVIYSECDDENEICQCKSGYYAAKRIINGEDECRKRVIGSLCHLTKDCSDAVANSTCNGISPRGNCKCLSGFRETNQGRSCQIRRIGDPCDNNKDADCFDAVMTSICKNKECRCEYGYYASNNKSVCIKRKIGDACSQNEDCDYVIANSECFNDTCQCSQNFDVHRNATACFPVPQNINSSCINSERCEAIHNDSLCLIQPGSDEGTCACPNDMYVDSGLEECVPHPMKVGDRCDETYQCTFNVDNSHCYVSSTSCRCDSDHYEDLNDTHCQPSPRQLGDRCLNNSQCTDIQMLPNAKIERRVKAECNNDSNTCVCIYGYKQSAPNDCEERDHLWQFEAVHDVTVPSCHACVNISNVTCVSRTVAEKQEMKKHCICNKRFAKAVNRTACQPVQTYMVKIHLAKYAGIYDILPIEDKFEKFAQRVPINGIKHIMSRSSLKDAYVSSDLYKVIDVSATSDNNESGITVVLLVHLNATWRYFHARSPSLIYRELMKPFSVNDNTGELGSTRLFIKTPFSQAIRVTDFNECEDENANDCSVHATCQNTVGSYMCFCKMGFKEVSKSHNKLRGRMCNGSKSGEDGDECYGADCNETRWVFVGLALALALVIVLGFIIYEIFQHKKSFNAKKLYEKFGTTKIRHLKKASLRRIQGSKKKRKKKKKKTKGKNKEGNTTESEAETSPLSPPNLNTEDVPPSPVEIIHTPSMPFEVDYPMTSPAGDRSQLSRDDPEAGICFMDSPDDSGYV